MEEASSVGSLVELIREEVSLLLGEARGKKKYPPGYRAHGKRRGKLDRATSMAGSDDPATKKAGYEARARMEKAVADRPGFDPPKRHDSEGVAEGLSTLRELVAEVVVEALSAKTKATLRKKAEKRGLTPGSVEAEYKKGLAAWGTSGSRPGMSQHQWAMARVNSANPSKSWAVVKKSKRKGKGKK